MSTEAYQACTFRLLRYVPNLLRDEWINVGVLLHDRPSGRLLVRCVADPEELARIRRIHPEADQQFLYELGASMESLLSAISEDVDERITKLESSLSNIVQLGPQKGVLTEDAAGEVDRIYAAQVAPPRANPREAAQRADTRAGLRTRASDAFRRAGIFLRLERGVRLEEFTFPGDPFRADYAYRQNGTRGFVHALSLLRDPNASKSLAFTAERVREQVPGVRFHAVTEDAPRGDGARFRLLADFLRQQDVDVVPVSELPSFANRLRSLVN